MQFNNYNIDLQTIYNLINILTSFHSFSIIYNNFNNENDDEKQQQQNKKEEYLVISMLYVRRAKQDNYCKTEDGDK